MMPAPRLSPGRFTALWLVLRSAAKLGDGVEVEQLLAFARRSSLRCGGLPVRDGYELARLGDFLVGDTNVTLTSLGRYALGRGPEEEPSPEALRLFISVLLLRYPPAWVAYWQGDPSSLDVVLPQSSRGLLRDARLLAEAGPEDLEAWALWDALQEVPPTEETAGTRKAIGDAAEELSYAYERQRLQQEGFPELANQVRWLAKESPAYGFDILSFAGAMLLQSEPDLQLAIEVKGQALRARGEFLFHVTRHEWQTSRTLAKRYIFHLWHGVRPGTEPSAAHKSPILINSEIIGAHIPQPPSCGSRCNWQSTVIVLPLERETAS